MPAHAPPCVVEKYLPTALGPPTMIGGGDNGNFKAQGMRRGWLHTVGAEQLSMPACRTSPMSEPGEARGTGKYWQITHIWKERRMRGDRLNRRGGFTLIELLVVIAIIAVSI